MLIHTHKERGRDCTQSLLLDSILAEKEENKQEVAGGETKTWP